MHLEIEAKHIFSSTLGIDCFTLVILIAGGYVVRGPLLSHSKDAAALPMFPGTWNPPLEN